MDIGCGTGDYLFESSNAIREGVGIDFSKQAIHSLNTIVRTAYPEWILLYYIKIKEMLQLIISTEMRRNFN
ncbi:MAG: hypothetical protein ACFFDN_22565 [Candidatus Hodarchaeota archaeon]